MSREPKKRYVFFREKKYTKKFIKGQKLQKRNKSFELPKYRKNTYSKPRKRKKVYNRLGKNFYQDFPYDLHSKNPLQNIKLAFKPEKPKKLTKKRPKIKKFERKYSSPWKRNNNKFEAENYLNSKKNQLWNLEGFEENHSK